MESKKTYSEQLKDPRWQKKRLEIMNRDCFTCCHCGDSESTLNIHHKKYTYGKNVWDYPNENLITLCESCHKKITIVKETSNDIIQNYGFLGSELLLECLQLLSNLNPPKVKLIIKFLTEMQYVQDIILQDVSVSFDDFDFLDKDYDKMFNDEFKKRINLILE